MLSGAKIKFSMLPHCEKVMRYTGMEGTILQEYGVHQTFFVRDTTKFAGTQGTHLCFQAYNLQG